MDRRHPRLEGRLDVDDRRPGAAALGPGEIVLMHVGSASTDAAALPAVISALRGRGYGFVTPASA